MYYEEKMIGGVLKYRTSTDGKWEVCAIQKAWDRITELQDEVRELRACMQTAENMLNQYT